MENPYFQHFTGETFFQHRPPIHPSSLSRWRSRIGEEGAEWLLTKTIEAGRAAGVVKESSLAEVVVDTMNHPDQALGDVSRIARARSASPRTSDRGSACSCATSSALATNGDRSDITQVQQTRLSPASIVRVTNQKTLLNFFASRRK